MCTFGTNLFKKIIYIKFIRYALHIDRKLKGRYHFKDKVAQILIP